MHWKRQKWFSQQFTQVALHGASNSLCVPLLLVWQVYWVQLALFNSVLVQLGCLGDDPRLTIEPLFIQSWKSRATTLYIIFLYITSALHQFLFLFIPVNQKTHLTCFFLFCFFITKIMRTYEYMHKVHMCAQTSGFDGFNTSFDKLISLLIHSSNWSTHTNTHTQTDRQTDRHRHTHTHTHTEIHRVLQPNVNTRLVSIITFNDFERGVDWLLSLHDL